MLKKHWITLAMIALAAIPIAAFPIGYYACGTPMSQPSDRTMRVYVYEWQARLFSPLARMESWLTGQKVYTGRLIHNERGVRVYEPF